MKKIMKRAMAVVMTMCMVAAMASCGGVSKEQQLQDAAATLDSVFAACEAPVTAIKATAEGTDIRVDAVVLDSLVRLEGLGDVLMNFYVAQQLKQASGAVINTVVNAVEANEGAVVLSLTDIYDFKREYKFTGANLRHLYSAKPSQLNGGQAKNELCDMLQPSLPNREAWADAQSVELSVKGGFLTYVVTFADPSSYARMKQGNITGLYKEPLHRSLQSLGSLLPSFENLCTTLGIEGIRVEYTSAKEGGRELAQAFPWRFIL